MNDIKSKLTELYTLEQLSTKNTIIHRLHPFSKIFVTVVYILCVVSCGRYNFQSLAFYFFYPIITMALADIPFKSINKRAMLALPFCIFAGISNIIYDRDIIFTIGKISVTGGVCSFLVIIIRSWLCVCAVLIIIASTPFTKLTNQLRRIYIPDKVVMLIEMLYRYIGVLILQADTMLTAYKLRSPGAELPHIKHSGAFIGQLFLHSVDRAERIYNAMKCRGYGLYDVRKTPKEKFRTSDYIFMTIVFISSILFVIIRS